MAPGQRIRADGQCTLENVDFSHLTRAVARSELICDGFTDTEIVAAVRRAELLRLAPGIYAPAVLELPFPEDRHRAIAEATARNAPGLALCRVSAAVMHGLPVWGMDLSAVHLRTDYAGSGTRVSARRVVHRDLPCADHVEVCGQQVTTVARTVVDLAKSQPLMPAVCAGDNALNRRLCTMDELRAELASIAGHPGAARATRAIARMNPLSESVFETRSRLLISDAGLPEPELQVDIVDDDGHFLGRVDFLWREFGVIGEADGDGKYLANPARTYRLEKERAERIVEQGWRFVRWKWRELETPGLVTGRIARVLAQQGSMDSTKRRTGWTESA